MSVRGRQRKQVNNMHKRASVTRTAQQPNAWLASNILPLRLEGSKSVLRAGCTDSNYVYHCVGCKFSEGTIVCLKIV